MPKWTAKDVRDKKEDQKKNTLDAMVFQPEVSECVCVCVHVNVQSLRPYTCMCVEDTNPFPESSGLEINLAQGSPDSQSLLLPPEGHTQCRCGFLHCRVVCRTLWRETFFLLPPAPPLCVAVSSSLELL